MMAIEKQDQMIWGYLIHLGYNMWMEKNAPHIREYINASDALRFDKPTFDEILSRLAAVSANTVVIDLGEGVLYESHPEIGVEGAWSVDQLRQELAKMRQMGLNPIPKLNFSTAHDEWLGEYARCVSTKQYYEVCRDLIREVIQIFDTPDFFHIGMDEETYMHQSAYLYAVVRQEDLWWHDLFFYLNEIESFGVRPWIWSDYIWNHPETFLKQMPHSVLQSNWYYGSFCPDHPDQLRYIEAYRLLDENGYDQVLTGSNWAMTENFPQTVDYGKTHLNPDRLLGFLQTVWKPTVSERKYRHFEAVDLIKEGRDRFYEGKNQ